jgi:hypothetical protein
MTSAIASPRYIPVLVILLFISACGPRPDPVPVPVVDLTRCFEHADKRPATGFTMTAYSDAGDTHPSIVATVPSRFTCALSMPRRARFHAYVALAGQSGGTAAASARVRIGISDDRIYEQLAERTLTPGDTRWIDVSADLSAYAGWKWSLFYRPDRMIWRLVLATDWLAAPSTVVWGLPQILSDAASAREYAARRPAIQGGGL